MTGPPSSRRKRPLRFAALLIALLVATVLAAPVSADPNNNNSQKLRNAVTLEGVRAHQAALQAIADLNGGTRFAGLPGFDASAAYVADQLRAAGYDVTVQEFVYDAFFENSPAQLQQVAPTPTTYVNGNDFRTMTYSGSGEATAAVTAVDYAGATSGCEAADFAGFPAGNIALMQRGGCSFRIKTTNAAAAGASAALVGNNTPGLLNGTLGDVGGLSTIPSLGLTQALGAQLSQHDWAEDARQDRHRFEPADDPQRPRRDDVRRPGQRRDGGSPPRLRQSRPGNQRQRLRLGRSPRNGDPDGEGEAPQQGSVRLVEC